jgi:hypothetical protein
VLTLLVLLVVACPAQARPGVALSGGAQLIPFDTAAPGSAGAGVAVTGLQAGESLLGVDYRPSNGKLYGLGSTSRLYRINEATGHATQVGPQFPTPLSGTSFGFDFSPGPDRIRVVSDNEQNFRVDPDSGLQTVDTGLSPAGSVGAAAYTNDYDGAATSTLFGIDYASDSLVRIGGAGGSPSPNAGGVANIGSLGADAGAGVSLDISFPGETAFATIGGTLYTVDLSTGAATLVGQISPSAVPASGIAVKPMNPGILYLDNLGDLYRTTPSSPASNTATQINVPDIPGEQLVAIDFRPATGELYGLGSGSHLFKVNLDTGAVTQIGSAFTPALSGSSPGFDFLASEDRIRLVTETDQNQRLDPDTAQVFDTDPGTGGTQGDPAITPGTSEITALAGTENYPGAPASATLGLDLSNMSLVRVQDNGTLATVGSLGVPARFNNFAGFDVIEPGVGLATIVPTVFIVPVLFLVDLRSGRATFIGTVAGASSTSGLARGLAIIPRGHFQHASAAPSVEEPAGQAALVVQRTRGGDGVVTIEYATADGSATAGQDYTATSGFLEFGPGETAKTVNVPVLNDSAIEDPETFTLTLTDSTNGATLSTTPTATVTIRSDDAPALTETPGSGTPTGGDNPLASPLPGGMPLPAVPAEPDSFIAALPKALAARKLTAFSGRATDADGDLARVEIAVVRTTGTAKAARAGCAALTAAFRLKTVAPVRGRCRPTLFLKAKGLARWSLKLGRRLPRGTYTVYSRAVDKGGRRETTFSLADGNRRVFTLR